MTTTETSKLRTMAGVIGIGSLALFGATACENGDADQEDGGGFPAEDNTQEEQLPDDGPEEDESLEEQEDM